MPEIEMYTRGFCGYCIAAKRLLKKKSRAFREIRIDRKPELREEMIQCSGNYTVPQIFIDGKAIGGFSEMDALDRSGELDKLLGDQSGPAL